jgi:hypothetical protein
MRYAPSKRRGDIVVVGYEPELEDIPIHIAFLVSICWPGHV